MFLVLQEFEKPFFARTTNFYIEMTVDFCQSISFHLEFRDLDGQKVQFSIPVNLDTVDCSVGVLEDFINEYRISFCSN